MSPRSERRLWRMEYSIQELLQSASMRFNDLRNRLNAAIVLEATLTEEVKDKRLSEDWSQPIPQTSVGIRQAMTELYTYVCFLGHLQRQEPYQITVEVSADDLMFFGVSPALDLM